MELLLNLLWLVVAVCSLIGMLLCPGRQRRVVAGPGAWRLAPLALGCALALLFPVISASDDLSCSVPVAEEAGSGSSLLAAGDHAAPDSLRAPVVAANLADGVQPAPALDLRQVIAATRVPAPHDFIPATPAVRGPPSRLL